MRFRTYMGHGAWPQSSSSSPSARPPPCWSAMVRKPAPADPCALGKERENLGIDFTAHVVGFDLPEGQARAQLQCLAKKAGGRYAEAGNAAELNKALGQWAPAVPAAPSQPIQNLQPPKGCEKTGRPSALQHSGWV